jgi:hypothetical protein
MKNALSREGSAARDGQSQEQGAEPDLASGPLLDEEKAQALGGGPASHWVSEGFTKTGLYAASLNSPPRPAMIEETKRQLKTHLPRREGPQDGPRGSNDRPNAPCRPVWDRRKFCGEAGAILKAQFSQSDASSWKPFFDSLSSILLF